MVNKLSGYGLPADQLDMLFHSLIISLFLFGIEVWGGAYKSILDKLIVYSNVLLNMDMF